MMHSSSGQFLRAISAMHVSVSGSSLRLSPDEQTNVDRVIEIRQSSDRAGYKTVGSFLLGYILAIYPDALLSAAVEFYGVKVFPSCLMKNVHDMIFDLKVHNEAKTTITVLNSEKEKQKPPNSFILLDTVARTPLYTCYQPSTSENQSSPLHKRQSREAVKDYVRHTMEWFNKFFPSNVLFISWHSPQHMHADTALCRILVTQFADITENAWSSK
jgi:hypothetical protein